MPRSTAKCKRVGLPVINPVVQLFINDEAIVNLYVKEQ